MLPETPQKLELIVVSVRRAFDLEQEFLRGYQALLTVTETREELCVGIFLPFIIQLQTRNGCVVQENIVGQIWREFIMIASIHSVTGDRWIRENRGIVTGAPTSIPINVSSSSIPFPISSATSSTRAKVLYLISFLDGGVHGSSLQMSSGVRD